MTFHMTGGLVSPPQLSYNSPSFPVTSLSASHLGALSPSQFVKPLPKLGESSGNVVERQQQTVLTEEGGGCPRSSKSDLMPSSRRSSVASSSSSLSDLPMMHFHNRRRMRMVTL